MKSILKKVLYLLGYQVSKIPTRKTQNTSLVDDNPFLKYIEDDLALYETPIGKYFLPYNIKTDVVINAMKNGKYFDLEIIKIAQEYIQKGTVVLDVGANFGQMSILFSELVGKDGKVYAFDADDFVFDILQKNIKINNCTNIEPIFGAVHELENQTFIFPKQDFKRFSAYGSYGIDPNAKEGRKVPSVTIDSLNITQPISFMKVDVQGSDIFAMRGAIETIKRHRMPIIFEFEQQFQEEFKTSFQDYVDFVNEIGYKFEKIVMDINYLIVPKS
ncbi:MAG: FkbM family methyltransferase [Bacteroidia bacterium]|nr:FkbM family methyltransferase [Bacteroidia bacterium]